MSIFSGPNSVSNGLVFSYDMSNTTKSFKGAPSTNYIPYPYANWNGSSFVFPVYNYANLGATYTYRPAVSTPLGYIGVMEYYTGTTGYKYFSVDSTSLPTTGTYTFSYYARIVSSTTGNINNTQLWRANGSDRAVTGDWNPVYTTEWVKYSTSGPAEAGTILQYFPVHGGTITGGVTVQFCGFQLELNSFSTSFVEGTRSNTQTLLDLTTNNTVTANLTYANNGTFSFNGTTDRLQIPLSGNPSLGCLEVAIKNYKAISPNTNMAPYYSAIGFTANGYATIGLNLGEWTGSLANETLSFWHYGVAQGAVSIQDTIDANWNIYHINWNGTTYDIWVNGTKRTTSSSFGTMNQVTNLTKMSVGYNEGWAYWFNGSIPSVKLYNRGLSDTEIQRNFEAQRSRYGI